MKYPFYTWFSVIGVMIQFGKTVIQIFTSRPFRIENWFSFCVLFLGVVFGFILLPGALMVIPLDAITRWNAVLGGLWNAAIFVVVYVMGVLGARILCRWRKDDTDAK